MRHIKITKNALEWGMLVAGGVGLWIVFFLCGAGPVGSDELLYINIGLNPFSDPYILNRYTHVYLEQFFVALSPNPLVGVRAFEATVLVVTSLLIYYNARRLTERASFLHGLIALGMFFSASYWGQLVGVPLIDFTVMMMMMIFVTIYLKAVTRGIDNPYWVIALGFTFLFGLKTKESFLVVAVLLVGLGVTENGRYQISRLGKNLLRFGAGFLAGVIGFIILNAIILKDPLFGFRLADFRAFQNIFVEASAYNTDPGNWYRVYLFEDILVPFALFLLAGVMLRDKLPPARRLIWLVPLMLVAFLTVTLIRSTWGVSIRYFIPAWPIVCTLGAHFIDLSAVKGWKSWLIFGATLLVGIATLGLARLTIIHLTQEWGWMMSNFLETIVSPLLFSLLLSIILVSQHHPTGNALMLVCLIGLIIYPLAHNGSQIIKRETQQSVDERYYPLSAFEAELQPNANMLMYVSDGVMPSLGVQEDNELFMLVNSYFGSNTTNKNYRIGSGSGWLAETSTGSPYQYILINAKDYRSLTAEAVIPERFEIITEPRKLYYLLQPGQ